MGPIPLHADNFLCKNPNIGIFNSSYWNIPGFRHAIFSGLLKMVVKHVSMGSIPLHAKNFCLKGKKHKVDAKSAKAL